MPEDRRAIKKSKTAITEFWEVFSTEGPFGKTPLIQHEIQTKDVPPIKSKYRPIKPVLEWDLKRRTEERQKHDVIEPSKSPWSLHWLLRRKRIAQRNGGAGIVDCGTK